MADVLLRPGTAADIPAFVALATFGRLAQSYRDFPHVWMRKQRVDR